MGSMMAGIHSTSFKVLVVLLLVVCFVWLATGVGGLILTAVGVALRCVPAAMPIAWGISLSELI